MTKAKTPPAKAPGTVTATAEPKVEPTPIPTPTPQPAATLADLDAVMTATGPADPGAAVLALGSPTPVEQPRNKGGRPRGSRNRPRTDGGAPGPFAQPPNTPGPSRAREETKAEIAAERDALRARMQVAGAQTFSDEDIANAKSAIMGLVALVNLGTEFGGLPEFTHSDDEANEIAEAFKKPAAPLLRSAGKYADLVVACGVLLKIEWPKIKAYKERVDREVEEKERQRLQRGRIGVDVTASPPGEPLVQGAPSSATMSGGVIP